MARTAKPFIAVAVGSLCLLAAASAYAKPNWTLAYSDPNSGNNLFSISAVEGGSAWAVGVSSSGGNSQGVGLRTMDGNNWFPMNLPQVQTGPLGMSFCTQVAFQNAQTGWLHGMAVSMAGQKGLIWRSDDGGGQWQQVFESANTYDQLQALPDGSVFAAGGTVVAASRDGLQFVEKPAPMPSGMDLDGITMLTADCGYAIATTPLDSGTMGAAVLWTGNGGDSWETRTETREYRLHRASFVTPTLGWAAGTRSGAAIIAKTTDGGHSWSVSQIPDHPPVLGQPATVPATDCVDVKFFDDQRGVGACLACTGDCEGAEGSMPSYLTVFVRTEDGGATWAVDPDYEPVMAAPPFGAMMKFSGMLAMAFPEPNTGLLTGQNNLILKYTAASPEPAGWAPPGCDPGTTTPGAGGGGGSSGPSATPNLPSSSDAGCGCVTTRARRGAGWGVVLVFAAALGAALRSKRRR